MLVKKVFVNREVLLGFFFLLSCGDDLLLYVRWHEFVVAKGHRVASASSCDAFELAVILCDLCQWNLYFNDEHASGEHVLAEYAASLGCNVACDVTHIVGWNSDFHNYDRLKQYGLSLFDGVDECAFAGSSKSDFL